MTAATSGTTSATGGMGYRTVRHPSIDFPVPPTVEMAIPESWRPIGAVMLNEMRPRPDIAVAGPDVCDGVRPNIMVKVSRIPGTRDGGDGVVPERRPAEILARLFARQGDEDGVLRFQCRIHGDEDQANPYGVSRYRERMGDDLEILRLTCAVIVGVGPASHLVTVQAGLSATSEKDLAEVEAAFASLRISAPIMATMTGEQSGERADG